MAKCKVCGAAHASCGPATIATVIPVDERVTLRKEGTVGDLKRYEVEVPGRNGRVTRTTLLLSDEDAAQQGLIKPAGKAAPSNKAAEAPANTAARAKGTK